EQENFRQQGIRRTLWLVLAFLGLLLGVGTFYFRAQNRSNKQLQHLNQELVSQKNVIEQQKVRLEELDESKSRFFTNISHEFKTPLTIIKGMVEKVREKPEVHLEKGTSMIRRNTLNLLNLVTQILDLRKLESKALKLNPQQGDVVPYLKYLTESHSSYAEQEGLILQFDSEQPELTMDFDPEKLLRITSNLLSNAIKFTESGGHVYLRVKQSKLNGKEALQLEVEDTGIGIAQENQANIFTQFYQEDDSVTRSGEGTGIGLALTQELVHLMQGTITVNSVPKQGSTFTVLLPITRMATLATEWSAPQIAAPIAKEQGANSEFISQAATLEDITEKPRLLVVEDNRDLQQYLLTTLEPYYTVDLAENGAIGIEKAIETIPDLIISDVMMPEKDGFELTDTLKRDERTDHIPIILLTAKSDVESKISGLEKGADAYLAKPFEERELLVRIDKLLELRRKLQQRYANNNLDTIPQQKIEDPFLQKLQDYVVENINDASLNMDQISRAVGMSRTQVFRKLKALTGKSATLFIRSIRLRKGQELLRTTNLTISEIAYEVGFTSLSYFSTSFMEEFGIRPSTVRS
ncbi:MAG: ATP-binding protein, partial [Bacteroidota bacterium]